ncbi:MAG: hypothetical protein JXA54_16660 [Candidatus Heimdallarchaeota archaeon]|nr:hypothetical protein [Candidatus Heimdallarchaeota archaeon]
MDLIYHRDIYEVQRVNLGENKIATTMIFGILGSLILLGLGGFIVIILTTIAYSEKSLLSDSSYGII